ncbi:integrin beta-3-like [Branchiostoma floridae x Branchiostoma japonicum]
MASKRKPGSVHLGTVLCLLLLAALARSDQECSATTCADCLRQGPKCGWCAEEGYQGPRCDLITTLQKNACLSTKIQNPTTEGPTKTKDLALSSTAQSGDIIQVRPQEISLKMRKGDAVQLSMQVRQVEDYPLDLYYLMDMSFSMKDDVSKLVDINSVLIREMKSLTNNFRVGLGIFLDKTVLPMVNTNKDRLQDPCPNVDTQCAPVFGFRHLLDLTDDADALRRKLPNPEEVSANRDITEGGLEALLQVAMCKEKIGWRDKATKMVLYASDEGFKMAGDGRLAAILPPNDGLCHLSSGNPVEYTELNNQDYPSVGQVVRVLREQKIQPIFAVTDQRAKNQLKVYKQLSNQFDSARTAELADDSSNIVGLVTNAYKELRSEVKLQPVNLPPEVDVAITPICPSGTTEEESSCMGLQVGDTAEFVIDVNVKDCPKQGQSNLATFSLDPVGFGDELKVNLEFLCSCECEALQVQASPKCSSGNGTLQCGICVCDQGRYGSKCECSADSIEGAMDVTASCKANNSNTLCSGRGVCICGQCSCSDRPDPNEEVYGQFCECDNFSCDRYQGMVCGGPDRGTCECGTCRCNDGWSGNACQCSKREDTCKAADGRICNGQGKCVCGKCECYKNSPYSGPTCETCPACPGQCALNKDCVQCQVFQSGALSPAECQRRCNFNSTVVDTFPESSPIPQETCRFLDEEDGCFFTFKYGRGEDNMLVVTVQEDKECPQGAPILPIVLGIVGGIVLIGLILVIIWRVAIHIYDKKQYMEFEKERQKVQFTTDVNPLYVTNTTKFINPTFHQAQPAHEDFE